MLAETWGLAAYAVILVGSHSDRAYAFAREAARAAFRAVPGLRG
jgi:hypothetical protein